MNALEVVLVLIGVGAYAASFVLPEKNKEKTEINQEEIEKIIREQIPVAKEQIEVEAKEQAEETVDKIERELEKLSNEKIMAVNEYSDTVMEEIQKNHTEVMFLYSMLNEKEQDVKDALKVINQAKTESQNFFEKTVSIVDKVDQEFDRIDKELKEFEERASDTIGGVQAQIEEVMKEPLVIPEPITVQIPEEEVDIQKVFASQEEKEKEEFDKGLIDTLHTMIPDFVSENQEEESNEPEVLVEREPKKQRFNFFKNSEGNKNEQVRELYKEGLSEVEIAKKLSIGRGEVRLIIGLMER
ncbi:MAG: hypothetical protein IJF03_09805 [Lachnospiraceae bacterium]|nr:hypothetical protein [Lachnospiraceae bacterium]